MVDPSGQSGAAGPLLETKLYIPRGRPALVARPRLMARLEQGAKRKLTLVSAPAGFGKTTLLAAPSTVGIWLRSFRWAAVRQLDGVTRQLLARAWQAGLGPALDAPLTIDIDSRPSSDTTPSPPPPGPAAGTRQPAVTAHPRLSTQARSRSHHNNRRAGTSELLIRASALWVRPPIRPVRWE